MSANMNDFKKKPEFPKIFQDSVKKVATIPKKDSLKRTQTIKKTFVSISITWRPTDIQLSAIGYICLRRYLHKYYTQKRRVRIKN